MIHKKWWQCCLNQLLVELQLVLVVVVIECLHAPRFRHLLGDRCIAHVLLSQAVDQLRERLFQREARSARGLALRGRVTALLLAELPRPAPTRSGGSAWVPPTTLRCTKKHTVE